MRSCTSTIARKASLDVVAPKLERRPALELHLPGAARRELHEHRRRAERRKLAPEELVLDRDFLRRAGGPMNVGSFPSYAA